MKILVVEDESSIRDLYTYKLELAGFEVDTAHNGLQGFSKCQSFQPDLILLDLKMPEMNGDEMLQKVRAEPWGGNIRVIILTNISRDEAPQLLRFFNIDRYMVKAHHTPSQIVEAIRQIFE